MSWRDRAACLDHDPEMWFPRHGDEATTARAVAICCACPVRGDCLAEAMLAEGTVRDRRHGIRGGLTDAQRHTLYRQEANR